MNDDHGVQSTISGFCFLKLDSGESAVLSSTSGNMMIQRIPSLFGIAVLTVGLAACSAGKPSQEDARHVFEHLLTSRLGPVPFVIQSFQKTNGQDRESGGVKTYVMNYAATVAFPEGYRSECVSHGNSFGGWNCFYVQSGLGGSIQPTEKGGSRSDSGELTFELTEKGWRGQDGQVY